MALLFSNSFPLSSCLLLFSFSASMRNMQHVLRRRPDILLESRIQMLNLLLGNK